MEKAACISCVNARYEDFMGIPMFTGCKLVKLREKYFTPEGGERDKITYHDYQQKNISGDCVDFKKRDPLAFFKWIWSVISRGKIS